MDGAELLKILNNMRKDIEELTRNTEIRFIKRKEQISKELKEVSEKSRYLFFSFNKSDFSISSKFFNIFTHIV